MTREIYDSERIVLTLTDKNMDRVSSWTRIPLIAALRHPDRWWPALCSSLCPAPHAFNALLRATQRTASFAAQWPALCSSQSCASRVSCSTEVHTADGVTCCTVAANDPHSAVLWSALENKENALRHHNTRIKCNFFLQSYLRNHYFIYVNVYVCVHTK